MIPLYKPYMPDLPEMDKILHSGQLAGGTYTKEFESLLQDYFHHSNVLATSSFNTAICVAITVSGLQPGDEIIASPMACLSSTQPYAATGLRIKWADVDPETGTLDPDSVKKTMGPNTKAIIHNHFCGYPGYIDEINDIAKEIDAIVVDDGIECFGSEYKGKMVGNCGTDITVFSFNPVRVLTTVDGGAVVFNNDDDCKVARLVRDCGVDRNIFRDEMGEINPNCDITIQGYSVTLSNVNAYIGTQQFIGIEKRLDRCRQNAKRWDEYIGSCDGVRTMKSPDGLPNYWVYGVLSQNKKDCLTSFRDMGYYASGVHINNNIYSVFGNSETLPGVKQFMDTFVALPCGWWMGEDDFPKV